MQKSFYSSLFFLISGSGITKILSIATAVLIVNAFGNANYGKYLLVIGIISLAGTAYAIISGQIYQVEFARRAGKKSWHSCKLLRNDAFRLTRLVAIATFVLLCMFLLAMEFLPSVPGWLTNSQPIVAAAAVLSIAGGFKEVVIGTNRGLGRFRETAIWESFEAVFRLALVGMIVLVGQIARDVFLLIAIDAAALALGATTYWLLLRNRALARSAQPEASDPPEPKLTSLIRNHGLWFALRLLVVELTVNGRNWLISGAISFEALGVYGIAKRIAQSGKMLLPMGVLFNSYFSHQSDNAARLKSSYVSGLRISAVVSLATMAFIVLVSLFVVPFFFTESVQTLQILIIIMSLIYPVKIISYGAGSMLNVDRRYTDSFTAVAVSGVSMLVLAPPLIYLLGVYGIAIEGIISSVAAAVVIYLALIRHRPDYVVPFSALVGVGRKTVKTGKN